MLLCLIPFAATGSITDDNELCRRTQVLSVIVALFSHNVK